MREGTLCTVFPRCFICKPSTRQSWTPLAAGRRVPSAGRCRCQPGPVCARPGVTTADQSLLIISWKLTETVLVLLPTAAGCESHTVHLKCSSAQKRLSSGTHRGQRQDNREMQKTSYSTRTRGTIPTTPTVNTLVIHRCLQLKDRVRTGLADLVSDFSLEHYKFTRCSAKDVGEWAECARTGTSPVRNHKQHASEDLTQPEVSELANAVRHVQNLTSTPQSITQSCISNRSPNHQFNSLHVAFQQNGYINSLSCSNL